MQSSPSSSSPKGIIERLYHPAVVWTLRLLVGAVFVFSGFVKSVDPWGSFFKISEYLEVWGWEIPSQLVVIAAYLLGGIEFVLGFLLLLGCYQRIAPVLMLLMMAFMLPLTAYLLIDNPVSDCGCFGDFLVISNGASFAKNIFLTIGILYLVKFNNRVGGLFVPYLQWVVGAILSLYILIVAIFGYTIQPMIDFRRFSPGTMLLSAGEDEDDNEPVYEFIYEKDGRKASFTLDNLPDSTWQFVDRHLVEGSEGVSDGFSVIYEGEDIAPDIISTEGEQFIVTIPDMKGVDLSYTYLLNDLNDFMEKHGGSMVALVSGDANDVEWWRDLSMASYPIYSAEPTLIKELARGRAALVYLKDGVVQWKRALSSISYAIVTETPADELADRMDPAGGYILSFLTLVFITILAGLFVLDRSGRLVGWIIRRRKHRKEAGETPCKSDRL